MPDMAPAELPQRGRICCAWKPGDRVWYWALWRHPNSPIDATVIKKYGETHYQIIPDEVPRGCSRRPRRVHRDSLTVNRQTSLAGRWGFRYAAKTIQTGRSLMEGK